jgi:hypothetical protein
VRSQLQQDKDMQYWGVNLDSIKAKAKDVGIKFIRCPVRNMLVCCTCFI